MFAQKIPPSVCRHIFQHSQVLCLYRFKTAKQKTSNVESGWISTPSLCCKPTSRQQRHRLARLLRRGARSLEKGGCLRFRPSQQQQPILVPSRLSSLATIVVVVVGFLCRVERMVGPQIRTPRDLLIPAAGRVCFGGALRNSATAMQVGGCGRGDG